MTGDIEVVSGSLELTPCRGQLIMDGKFLKNRDGA